MPKLIKKAAPVAPVATDAAPVAPVASTALAIVAPVTDAAPDAAPDAATVRAATRAAAATLQRALDPDRKSLSIGAPDAKPLAFNRPAGSRSPTLRTSSALAVAILASGQRLPLATDAAPVTFPRVFTLTTGETASINYGAGCTILVSGAADYNAATGDFTVSHKQAVTIRDFILASVGGKIAATL